MNTLLVFFLLLIPLSGFIAWVGDRIGHKIGRRRQSLFGLRPRHTAIVITIATGIGIMLSSFAGMMLVSRGFRNVVARGAALARDNQALLADNQRLSSDIRTAKERVDALRSDAVSAAREARAATTARDRAVELERKAERDVADARRLLGNAERALAGERNRLGSTRSELERAVRRVESARKAVEDATSRRAIAEKQRTDAETRTKSALADAETAKGKVANAERVFEQVMRTQKERLDEQRRLLRAQEAEIESQSERIAAQQARIGDQDGTIATQAARLEEQARLAAGQRAEVVRLSEEVADLGRKREEYQAALDDMVRAADALRNRRVVFRVGEEVARLPIAPGVSVWKVQNALEGFLTAAAKKAEGRGARTGKGALRAVYVPERRVRSGSGRVDVVSEMDALHETALAIRGSNEDVVVVLTATANAVVGEPVPVEVKTYRNPLLFAAGAELGEIVLQPDRPRQEVLDTLYAFLSGEIRRKLLRAGLIPVSSGSGLDLEPVGEAGMDALLKVMEEVRVAGRTRVVVKTARDLRAGETVQLDFEVRPAGDDRERGRP
ncbi:MAG: DUF3084 domain-containing protein [Armatimonadota bacterium]